jgi:hypothetical protein
LLLLILLHGPQKLLTIPQSSREAMIVRKEAGTILVQPRRLSIANRSPAKFSRHYAVDQSALHPSLGIGAKLLQSAQLQIAASVNIRNHAPSARGVLLILRITLRN